jgi:hypothetical protein
MAHTFTTAMHASSEMENIIYSAQGNTTTHLSSFEQVDQTAFADVGEAKDTDGDALLCAALGLDALRRRSNVRTRLGVPIHRTGLPVCVLGPLSRRLVQLAHYNRGLSRVLYAQCVAQAARVRTAFFGGSS